LEDMKKEMSIATTRASRQNIPYRLTCDASDVATYGTGARTRGDKLKPIGFLSAKIQRGTM